MACSNCRKRKIRCKPTEQPPNNPCARCVKKNLTCEYVAAPEPAYYSRSATQTPERPVIDLPAAGQDPAPLAAPMRETPSVSPPTYSLGGVPSFPYTGPPPLNLLSRASHYPVMHTAPANPTFAAWNQGSNNPESNRPYVHPQYYAPSPSGSAQPYIHPQYVPGQPNTQYHLQAAHEARHPGAHASQSQPSFIEAQPQYTEYPFDYTQFLNENEWAPGPSSRQRYHNNNYVATLGHRSDCECSTSLDHEFSMYGTQDGRSSTDTLSRLLMIRSQTNQPMHSTHSKFRGSYACSPQALLRRCAALSIIDNNGRLPLESALTRISTLSLPPLPALRHLELAMALPEPSAPSSQVEPRARRDHSHVPPEGRDLLRPWGGLDPALMSRLDTALALCFARPHIRWRADFRRDAIVCAEGQAKFAAGVRRGMPQADKSCCYSIRIGAHRSFSLGGHRIHYYLSIHHAVH
ncbi:hypothetical protein DFH09DRAFT_1413761 [Mycena vulgaris]|nr:hypothetical protein DFH09DRAFT_1413761 [Mycena vulgaris]